MFSAFDGHRLKMRAKISVPPPAANGTTMVTGRDGNVSA
jgi:hypothetical protein